LTGGALAAVIAGGTLSLGSVAGFFALTGLAARGVIHLFRGYQRMERTGRSFDEELIRDGARERFSPVLISSIATILALLPMVIAGDIAGLEVVRPMAVVMIGGLVTSTLVVLLILPAMYLRHGYVANPDTVAEELVVIVPEAEPEEVVPAPGS
jgi:Cu/Ag efflux pump CusA